MQPVKLKVVRSRLEPVVRQELSDVSIARIKRVKELLAEIENSPLEVWIDNFKRGKHLEDSLLMWESIVESYDEFTAGKQLTFQKKKDILKALLGITLGPAKMGDSIHGLTSLESAIKDDLIRLHTARLNSVNT